MLIEYIDQVALERDSGKGRRGQSDLRNINYLVMEHWNELEEVLALYEGKPLVSDGESLEGYTEICSGCVAVAEESLKSLGHVRETGRLGRTFLHYASHLEGFDHKLNFLYSACGRMADTIYEHPRLKRDLLRLRLLVIRRLECGTGHELSIAEDVASEIRRLSMNIEHADNGRLDLIENDGILRHDPVEWTARWEEIIDEADRIVMEEAGDQAGRMGFCHLFWSLRRDVLQEKFGMQWRSPASTNPGVLFD